MTITRGFGLSINTRAGETTRWAAGDPASVAAQLDAARERMQAANVPTLDQIREHLGLMADTEVLGRVITHRPAGSQCIQCEHSARDCSALDFAAMRPAGRCDRDGSQRVACSEYVRAGIEQSSITRPCRCGPDGCSAAECEGKR